MEQTLEVESVVLAYVFQQSGAEKEGNGQCILVMYSMYHPLFFGTIRT